MHILRFAYPKFVACTGLVLISLCSFTENVNLRNYAKVKTYPAPKGIAANKSFKVIADGKEVHVYDVRVAAGDPRRRFKAVDDLLNSEQYYDMAAFAYFDMGTAADIRITSACKISTFKILPSSANIKARLVNNQLLFRLNRPQNLVIEINGNIVNSLQLFANPLETVIPSRQDTNVVYFGPGVHEVSGMVIGDNKTVYIAGGAVVRTVVGKQEGYGIEPSGLKNYVPSFELRGKNIKFKGRGIIDASASPTHARNLIMVHGTNIDVEGIIMVNSSGWTLPLRSSKNVRIKNVKILGYRANSDGIDICNSNDVVVDSCFIRTNDDLIVVKTWENQGSCKRIVVKNCVLWNQLANALSLGAELREDVSDVLFYNCDIIHNTGRAWCLRIFHTDDAKISNIRFQQIRINEGHQLIALTIGKDIASHNGNFGTINGVTFDRVEASGGALNIDIVGENSLSKIHHVTFRNVLLNGKVLPRNHVKTNSFVDSVKVIP